jgi:molecular chaperone DnaK
MGNCSNCFRKVGQRRSRLGRSLARIYSARLFYERLELDLAIDDDLILRARAWSSMEKDEDRTEVHDLEFGLALPRQGEVALPLEPEEPEPETEAEPEKGGLAVRANVADEANAALVPGEVLHRYNKAAFGHGIPYKATDEQRAEYLYYQPCGVCRRDWNDPACHCAAR